LCAGNRSALTRVKPGLPDFVEDPAIAARRKRRRDAEAQVCVNLRYSCCISYPCVQEQQAAAAFTPIPRWGQADVHSTSAEAGLHSAAGSKLRIPSSPSCAPSTAEASFTTAAQSAGDVGGMLFSNTPLKAPQPPSTHDTTAEVDKYLQPLHWASWPASIMRRTLVVPASPSRAAAEGGRCVVYWCRSCWRTRDNWALWSATWIAHTHGLPLIVLASVPIIQAPPPPPALLSFRRL